MFAKLLKYEWRNNAATYGILSLCVLGVSLLGGFALRYIVRQGEYELSGSALVGVSLMLLLVILSLFAYAAAIYIMQLVRFYKNKFTDEGYLTFTLPVTSHQIFLSSAVNMLIWTVISLLVLGLCLVIMGLIATAGLEIPEDFRELVEAENLFSEGYDLLSLLSQIVSLIFGVVTPLTCLTVGASLAKKHKILAAFGIYYVTNMIMSFMQGMMTISSAFGSVIYSEENFQALTMENMITTMIVQLVVILAGYFLSTCLMKKKLNLN